MYSKTSQQNKPNLIWLEFNRYITQCCKAKIKHLDYEIFKNILDESGV